MVHVDENMSDEGLSPWHWTDYFSHYRYWALSLGLMFVQFTGVLFNNTRFQFLSNTGAGSSDLFEAIFPIYIFSTMIGAIFVLYAVRKRFKTTLLSSAILYVILIVAFFLLRDLPAAILMSLIALIAICSAVFWVTVVVTILQGRSNTSSLTIIAISTYITSQVTALILGMYANKIRVLESLDEPWQYCFIVIPAIIGIILLAFANRKFFTLAPTKTIEPQIAERRSPVAVALLSAFVPFYYYYFIATRPRELKTLGSEIKTPTGGGMIAMVLFAGLITPLWYARMREALKETYPENVMLKKRSHKFIGFISILFPAFGAAMLQSDMNAVKIDTDSRGQ